MITLHTAALGEHVLPDLSAQQLPKDVVWIDLMKGDAAERASIERATGIRVPTFERLVEIESSSRLATENGALYLSTPMIYRGTSNEPLSTPLGFVLTRDLLLTVRFYELGAFPAFEERCAKTPGARYSSAGVFIGLIEVSVDRMADLLERLAAELDLVSHRIFRAEADNALGKQRPARETANLRQLLRRVGGGGDLVSKLRDSLLGVERMVPYVANGAAAWLGDAEKLRLTTLRADIASLNDHALFMTNKVQLLLDATLGLINIEQNNIIKVLTIVSVVGVPPTLVASMYGMNFKDMPELSWAWGYPYGLTLILISAVLPLLWFKWRGWL